MATATSTYASYDRSVPPSSVNFRTSDNSTLSRQNHGFFTANTNPVAPRPGQYLDDMDLLALKRQYANIGLLEQSVLLNSAEDLSQIDRVPYQFEVYDHDQDDIDDYDPIFDDGVGIDYNIAIQERLKKANEEFKDDQTSAELKHRQRVSFDTVVKAVDIVQDPAEYDNSEPLIRPSISTVIEEPSADVTSQQNETNTHAYTVPLNDTQPKEGPTLLQQIKAMQYHGVLPTNGPWLSAANSESSVRNDDVTPSSIKSTENNIDNHDLPNTTTSSPSSQKSMIVSVNGRFALQNKDDYTAQHDLKSNDDDKDNTSTTHNKVLFLPTPPTKPKQGQDPPRRPFSVRPKSSDSGRRTDVNTIKTSSDNKKKTETVNRQRPKSANVSKTSELYVEKPSSGVDFDELLRKASDKKRAELREERRKKEEVEAKRPIELAKAKESFERWMQDKDAERKRINEEKRLEKEEQDARQTESEKELAELREKKYKEWLERKDIEAMIANEFRKLKAGEDEMTSGGLTSSINNGNRSGDHRAFQRWLRWKYEQSMKEKRQIRLEVKRQRRQQRRSIKRFHLQQDLQLAKSYGYS